MAEVKRPAQSFFVSAGQSGISVPPMNLNVIPSHRTLVKKIA
jgi:hypothetical protein